MKKPFLLTVLISSLVCQSSFGFELHGTGNTLRADGGIDTPFIPIMQENTVFAIQSLPQTLSCQGDLSLSGLASIGSTPSEQDNLALFLGNGGVAFGLFWRAGGDWQALAPASKIPCRTGQAIELRAKFFRQSNVPSTQTAHIRQTFALHDGNTDTLVTLTAQLNFAKPPSTYSCQLTTGEQTIKLAPVSVQALERQHRIQHSGTANITLNCNDARTTVWVMAYDHLTAASHPTALSIKPNGATGVGVELYHQNQPILLGQKPVGTPSFFETPYWRLEGETHRTLTLNAGYLKTGKVGAGAVHAQAGLVFFYP